MKTKKLEEFSKDGFVAYAISLMYPEIIEKHILKTEENNSEWLPMDVLDDDDNSKFPVRIIRNEDPSEFILVAEKEYEVDLAYQLGQISVIDFDMQEAKELEETLSDLNKVSEDLKEKADNVEKNAKESVKTLEEILNNLKGAAE